MRKYKCLFSFTVNCNIQWNTWNAYRKIAGNPPIKNDKTYSTIYPYNVGTKTIPDVYR